MLNTISELLELYYLVTLEQNAWVMILSVRRQQQLSIMGVSEVTWISFVSPIVQGSEEGQRNRQSEKEKSELLQRLVQSPDLSQAWTKNQTAGNLLHHFISHFMYFKKLVLMWMFIDEHVLMGMNSEETVSVWVWTVFKYKSNIFLWVLSVFWFSLDSRLTELEPAVWKEWKRHEAFSVKGGLFFVWSIFVFSAPSFCTKNRFQALQAFLLKLI